jgi:lipopolysaccharide biosynthesis regulator YciM
MEFTDYRLILIAVLICAVVVMAIGILIQRRKRGRSRRSLYIEALYALIDGRREEAFKLLSKAVRNGEDDIDAYIQLGNLMRERDQAEKALQLHRGLTVRSGLSLEDEKIIQLSIAEDLAALGMNERAITALETVRKKVRDADVLSSLFRLYDVQGEYERAFGALKELSRVDSSVTSRMKSAYLTSVAYSLIDSEDLEKAGKFLEKARKEDSKCPGALYLSASLAMDRGDLSRSVKIWEELLSVDMGYFSEAEVRLEKALFESGRFDELEGILLRLLEKYPSNTLLLSSLAGFYSKKGETERGISILEGEREMIATDTKMAVSLASLYMKNRKYEKALSVLEESDRFVSKQEIWKCSNCGEEYSTRLGFCRACCSFDTIRKDETNR